MGHLITMTEPVQDARLSAPAVARNRDPILAVLRRVLPGSGLVLEIASGTGEHAAHFAPAFAGLAWQPSDPRPAARASIDAWAADAGPGAGIRPALDLDVTRRPWPVERADAVVCINMIHISPPGCTPALLEGAAALLPSDGPLTLYGPFRIGGAHTAESNESFDAWLKSENPEYGIRDLEAVADMAAAVGFGAPETVPMPANNFSVIFRRR